MNEGKIRELLKDALKDKADNSHAGIQRIPPELLRDLHHIHDFRRKGDGRMNQKREFPFIGQLIDTMKLLKKDRLPIKIGKHLDSPAAHVMGPLQLLAGLVWILIGKARQPVETSRVFLFCRFQVIIAFFGPVSYSAHIL